ncbi:zinc-ribbon domain-containing protein, partial [Coprococcus comes]|uniref:zinc-ribbon domain-containing protein n=1 Tax=Coprococcus comes TaxID=410072 RepID=UPI001FBA9E72
MLASLHLLILLPEVPDRLHQQQLVGFNDLATLLPDIAAEWSEKNLPLKPDEVNAKSRKNVWWRCSKCGNEWKSVINARVKGTVCPVCAEREVLAGYNDL